MRSRSGPLCHVCAHRELASINLALARGVSVAAIAKRYRLGTATLYRHAKRPHCLPASLRAKLIAGPSIEGLDLDKVREAESQSLLLHLVNLRHRLFAALDQAEIVGDGHMLGSTAGQIHRNLELTGKLLGDISAGTTITNVLVLPAYVALRVELVRALAPFPEARQAVAKVLHDLEGKAAKDITAQTHTLEFAT